MRARLLLMFMAAAGCGDNIHIHHDASVDGGQTADVPMDTCAGSVTTIQPGNPGANPSSYPAPGWWSDDTRANGMVVLDGRFAAPPGFGCTAAVLSTGASTPSPSADKAQLISYEQAGVLLLSITSIGYWAYRSSSSTGGPAIALSLNVSVTGSTVPGGAAILVYEPYHQSGGTAAIEEDTWQHWDATATSPGDGRWWTSKIPNGGSPAMPGSQDNPQSWAAFQAAYSDAKILGYGFNLGSVNPNMVVAGDGLTFGTTTTDF